MSVNLILLDAAAWAERLPIAGALVRAYATGFWCGAWKELLAVRGPDGRVARQFGTVDGSGVPYGETRALLERTGISEANSAWPELLWEAAARGEVTDVDGSPVTPYWSLEEADRELSRFVLPPEEDGFGGEMLVAEEDGAVAGFTAYACAPGSLGRAVADRRFPTQRLHVPIDAPSPRALTVGGLLESLAPGEGRLGVFLDHAVSEARRGNGLGSRLFDARIDRLVERGADRVFGRTLVTAAPQYAGNYLARGLRPVAADGTDPFSGAKHYFLAERSELRPRRAR